MRNALLLNTAWLLVVASLGQIAVIVIDPVDTVEAPPIYLVVVMPLFWALVGLGSVLARIRKL